VNTAVDTAKSNSNLVVTDGSTLYYALLFVEQALSIRFLETLQFTQTLSNTLIDVSEGQVAEKKIHWWHEELSRLSKQQSRHPDAICVQTYLHSNSSIAASLAILSAAAAERYSPFASEQALNDSIIADYGARLALFEAAMDSPPDSNTRTPLPHGDKAISFHTKPGPVGEGNSARVQTKSELIAHSLGQFDRLNTLAKRLRCGYSVFSDERYEQYKLTPDDLLNHAMQQSDKKTDSQQNVRTLLDSAVTDAHSSIEKAINRIAELRTTEPTNLTVDILCQIRFAQLKLWKKRKPNLLIESVTLTPIRKFFIAYRCKRRFEHR